MSTAMRRGLVAVAVSALAVGVGVLPAQAEKPEKPEKEVAWYLGPSPVDPGGRMFADEHVDMGGCYPATPVTSPGLVEPLRWTMGGNHGRYSGYGTAIKKPGTYVATFTCNDGRKASQTFVIKGTPESPTPTPTTTKPKPPAPKPKPQVVVKPKGAPATGGGYSAA